MEFIYALGLFLPYSFSFPHRHAEVTFRELIQTSRLPLQKPSTHQVNMFDILKKAVSHTLRVLHFPTDQVQVQVAKAVKQLVCGDSPKARAEEQNALELAATHKTTSLHLYSLLDLQDWEELDDK